MPDRPQPQPMTTAQLSWFEEGFCPQVGSRATEGDAERILVWEALDEETRQLEGLVESRKRHDNKAVFDVLHGSHRSPSVYGTQTIPFTRRAGRTECEPPDVAQARQIAVAVHEG